MGCRDAALRVHPVATVLDQAISRGKGAARSGRREFSQFLRVALGSLSELETQLLIAERLNYIHREGTIPQQVEAVRRLLLDLIKHLKKDPT